MKKKFTLFILIFSFILLIIYIKYNKNLKNIEENGTIIIMNYEKGYNYENPDLYEYSINEFYIKKENQKISKISNDTWLDFGFVYLNGKDNFLYVDSYRNLRIVSKNNFNRIIGKNIAIREDNKYNLDFGYIEKFGYFLNPYSKDIKKSFGASKNGKTIGYIDSKLDFFISKNGNARKYISDNVTSFTIDYFGKNVYYTKDKNKLYLYKNGNSQKITDDIKNFLISKDGNNVIWIDSNYDIYFKNIETNNKYKICNDKNGIYAIINDDNSILYTKVNSKSKDLFRFSNNKNQKIVSDVIGFLQYKNIIYYIDEENNLFEIDIENNYKKNKIKSNIKKFVLFDSKIYFLDYNNDVYKKENNKKIENVASDVSDDYVILDDNVVYKKNNLIYINNKKISDKIKAFTFNSHYIAYVDIKDQVHVYNVKNKKDSIQIKDAKKHSRIYLGNNFLYQTNINTEDIKGYYCTQEDFFINNKRGRLVKFEKNNKIIFFFDDNTKQEYFYEKDGKVGYISEGISFFIKNKSLEIELEYFISYDRSSISCNLKMISKNEFDKKLNEIKLINKAG